MIKSRSDYLHYLRQDQVALRCKGNARAYLSNEIWRFQRRLRKVEYLGNCCTGPIGRLRYQIANFMLWRLAVQLGFTIPPNVFGPGLSIAHRGTIVVNSRARIGANCRIHVCVNIGAAIDDGNAAPQIGDDCYIGPGVKIYGRIVISDNTTIGANAVVNRSFLEPSITIAGVPARKIADRGTSEHRGGAKREQT